MTASGHPIVRAGVAPALVWASLLLSVGQRPAAAAGPSVREAAGRSGISFGLEITLFPDSEYYATLNSEFDTVTPETP